MLRRSLSQPASDTSPGRWKLGCGGVLPQYVKRLILHIQHSRYSMERESKKHHSCILPPILGRALILEPNDKQQHSSSGTTGHLDAAMGLFGIVAVLGSERRTFACCFVCFRWRGGRQKLHKISMVSLNSAQKGFVRLKK